MKVQNGIPAWSLLREVVRLPGGRTPEVEREARQRLEAWGSARGLKMGRLESVVFPTKHTARRVRFGKGERTYAGPTNCTDWYADFHK